MNRISKNKTQKVSRIMRGTFNLPKHALLIHQLISSKYKNTFVVGGAVRNFLLQKKISEVDIATSATPVQIKNVLKENNISFDAEHEIFGVIIALVNNEKIEITTFRKEIYAANRFPKVKFTKSIVIDSNRRDFTMNALYYSPETKEILDFHNGLQDVLSKTIKFIGNAQKRISEDPLRIVRAYRIKLQYGLQIEKETEIILKDNINLIKSISKKRLQKEINALTQTLLQKSLQKVIHSNS
jgi:tRNA nucleotidyltransferase/poly(A) polymerase